MDDISDYADAVERVVDKHVPADVTRRDEVVDAVRAADAPQVDETTAQNIGDAIVTEEEVFAGIENRGETPSFDDIRQMSRALDNYDLGDRADSVADRVETSVVTEADVASATAQARESGGDVVFQSDVEDAVDETAGRKSFVGRGRDDVVSDVAHETGAPTEQEFRAAGAQALQGERVETDEGSAFAVTSTDGEPVGVIGGTVAAREAAAEETGAENLGNVSLDDVETRQTRGKTEFRLRGETVGEVEIR